MIKHVKNHILLVNIYYYFGTYTCRLYLHIDLWRYQLKAIFSNTYTELLLGIFLRLLISCMLFKHEEYLTVVFINVKELETNVRCLLNLRYHISLISILPWMISPLSSFPLFYKLREFDFFEYLRWLKKINVPGY